MKKTAAVCLFFVCFFSLCAGGKKDFFSLEKIEEKYPSKSYITGAGQGTSLSSASASAKLSVCQTLGESLKGQQKVYDMSSDTGLEESSLSVNVDETVLYDHITGIEIKETYKTGVNEWICVAVLDKKEASSYYHKLADTNDSKINELVKRASAKAPSFESLELMDEALQLSRDNEYNLDLLLALTKNRPVMIYTSTQSLLHKKADIASLISVNITVENDKDGQIKAALIKKFENEGIKTVSEGALFDVRAELSLEETASPDNKNIFVRYIFNCPVTDRRGNTVKSFNVSGREGHLTREQAVQRCYTKLAVRIAEEF